MEKKSKIISPEEKTPDIAGDATVGCYNMTSPCKGHYNQEEDLEQLGITEERQLTTTQQLEDEMCVL